MRAEAQRSAISIFYVQRSLSSCVIPCIMLTDFPSKALEEIHKLRAQISNIVQTNFPDLDSGFVAKLPPPTAKQVRVLIFHMDDLRTLTLDLPRSKS